MIRTVTFSTGVEDILSVRGQDILSRQTLAGGKGINAARTIGRMGHQARAYAIVAGDMGAFDKCLEGVIGTFVESRGELRRNLTLCYDGEEPRYFKAPLTPLDTRCVEELLEHLMRDVGVGDIVSLHGGTPPGVPVDSWARFARVLSAMGALVVGDVYGPALKILLREGVLWGCKINEEEAAILGTPVQAIAYMRQCGVDLPMVTRASRGLIYESETVKALACAVKVRQSVGAGDAAMAGVLVGLEEGLDRDEIALLAMAAACVHVEATQGDFEERRAYHSSRTTST